ncbi:MAG: SGNH/GDSL hydrolase family protein [Candidatus Pelagibacter sp. TMED263]|nr:MAG: SGNH/GDSL hydrolase family protein [Candidatus Pelagibacter sp. TMED263]
MIKSLKVTFYNLLFFLLAIIIMELIFGYWFDKNNFGPYMREHRMKKVEYSLQYEGKTFNHTYKRNYHGFRGEEISPKNIDAIIVGGSTTDERYKPEEQTITEFLNKKILQKNINLKIINAGIEGQSTLGHIFNFQVWFPKLEEFKPKYIIFYIGINDFLSPVEQLKKAKLNDGHIVNPDLKEEITDNIKSRSVFYDLLRKTKHRYYTSNKPKVIYDFDHSVELFHKNKEYRFLNYNDALKLYDINKLIKQNKEKIKYYLDNVDILYNETIKLKATPVFINQLDHEGHYNKKLFSLNYSLINHCKKKNYKCIDLASKLEGKKNYWWDGTHTTAKGSEIIADLIFPELHTHIK